MGRTSASSSKLWPCSLPECRSFPERELSCNFSVVMPVRRMDSVAPTQAIFVPTRDALMLLALDLGLAFTKRDELR